MECAVQLAMGEIGESQQVGEERCENLAEEKTNEIHRR